MMFELRTLDLVEIPVYPGDMPFASVVLAEWVDLGLEAPDKIRHHHCWGKPCSVYGAYSVQKTVVEDT